MLPRLSSAVLTRRCGFSKINDDAKAEEAEGVARACCPLGWLPTAKLLHFRGA